MYITSSLFFPLSIVFYSFFINQMFKHLLGRREFLIDDTVLSCNWKIWNGPKTDTTKIGVCYYFTRGRIKTVVSRFCGIYKNNIRWWMTSKNCHSSSTPRTVFSWFLSTGSPFWSWRIPLSSSKGGLGWGSVSKAPKVAAAVSSIPATMSMRCLPSSPPPAFDGPQNGSADVERSFQWVHGSPIGRRQFGSFPKHRDASVGATQPTPK